MARGYWPLLVAASALAVQAQTARPSSTPTPSASLGSSPSPSPSSRPLPYGVIREIAVLDCNGGLHIMPGHPLEMNFNLRGVRQALNTAADEIKQRAKCAADRYGCPELTDEMIERHFVPGVPMLLNFLEPLALKRTLPPSCMTHTSGVQDNRPMFAQTFWDQSPITTVFASLFNISTAPRFLYMPDTCTYESYVGGIGCKFQIDDPITATKLQVGVDKCPGSYLPYVSVSCKGPYCPYFGKPCGGINDCGGGTNSLVCRSVEPGQGLPDQIIKTLQDLKLLGPGGVSELNNAGDCSFSGGGTGRDSIARTLRQKLFDMFNVSVPSITPPGAELTFCLPPDPLWDEIQRQIDDDLNREAHTDLSQSARVTDCSGLRGCNVLDIGNGKCNIECYVPQCLWDGNDCGGPPTETGVTVVDNTMNKQCTIQPEDVTNKQNQNPWEQCNGYGECVTFVSGSSQCQRCNCPLPGGVTDPGLKCENCLAPRTCETGNCKFSATHMLGLQSRLQPWDGQMYDGFNVLEFDKKSGVNLTTPSAMFDIGAIDPSFRTLVQHTCAGELGVSIGNGFLQAGMHAPWLQDMVGFLGGFVADLANCRSRSLSNPTLSPIQIETRFMAHHPAFWMYQMTWFGRTTLQQKLTEGFGSFAMVDPLMFDWAQREPSPPPAATATPFLQAQEWGKAWRMLAPVDGACSYDTATDFNNPAGRRCRFTWTQLGSLLMDSSKVHLDMRMDTCSGAATGQRLPAYVAAPSLAPQATPYPTATLDPNTAKYALPAFSAYYSGSLAQMVSAPTTCILDIDCKQKFGSAASCVNLDTAILKLKDYFKGRSVDPLGQLLYGRYNVERDSCSSVDAVRVTIRSFLQGIAGRQRDGLNDLNYCFINPTILVNSFKSWEGQAYDGGTCMGPNYWDPKRNCLQTPPEATYAAGRPVTIKGMTGPERDFVVPPSGSGIAKFVPVGRAVGSGGSYPRGSRAPANEQDRFSLSLPIYTSKTFTNNVKERLRWAISTSLTQFNFGMSPDNVIITDVTDNPFDIRPGGEAVGVLVAYYIDVPDYLIVGNLTTQLQSKLPNTFGSQMGYYLATLGLVPWKEYRKVGPGKLCIFNCVPKTLTDFEIFIILISSVGGVILIGYLIHLFVLKPRGIKVPFVPSPAFFVTCCTVKNVKDKLAAARASASGGASSPNGPQRKTSRVDGANPMSELDGLEGGEAGATAAATGSRQTRVVNILRSAMQKVPGADKLGMGGSAAGTGATAAAPAPAAAAASSASTGSTGDAGAQPAAAVALEMQPAVPAETAPAASSGSTVVVSPLHALAAADSAAAAAPADAGAGDGVGGGGGVEVTADDGRSHFAPVATEAAMPAAMPRTMLPPPRPAAVAAEAPPQMGMVPPPPPFPLPPAAPTL